MCVYYERPVHLICVTGAERNTTELDTSELQGWESPPEEMPQVAGGAWSFPGEITLNIPETWDRVTDANISRSGGWGKKKGWREDTEESESSMYWVPLMPPETGFSGLTLLTSIRNPWVCRHECSRLGFLPRGMCHRGCYIKPVLSTGLLLPGIHPNVPHGLRSRILSV